jgi:CRISPR-associated endonuclease/helicase Cas3
MEAPPPLPLPISLSSDNRGFQVAFFTRMLFSCLIDADRTATEAFCDADRSARRLQEKPAIRDLLDATEAFLAEKQRVSKRTLLNHKRAEVLSACIEAAALAPGFFSLTVPTGGGKTYASLAFGLHHALRYGLRRVIVALPFTTIIEQNADAYREAVGPYAALGVVEHHSNISPAKDTRENQLAAENWDAPLVVTTNVQMYESLFAAATTPCRKLHRVAKSVIVLDEAQTMPVDLLRPTLSALQELVRNYGCTVVLCTATQPALDRRDQFDIGIEAVRPIIRDVAALYAALRRVVVTHLGKVGDDELGRRLAREASALCIVNSRPHASKLYDNLCALNSEACFHLSTFMCAEHRRDKLAEIRRRLREGETCRVVSTQLVEAGVDIDFPVVYRALAGFDSIAQAAGRCNREGLLAKGRVYVFDTESPPPPGFLRNAAQTARELRPLYPDPLDPAAAAAYFAQFYWSQNHLWDRNDVLGPLSDDLSRPQLRLNFRTAASRYKLIRDVELPVLVSYDDQAHRIRDRLLANGHADFTTLRSAQRYLVGIYERDLMQLAAAGSVVSHESGLYLLVNDAAYSSDKGLSAAASGMDAHLLIL